MTKRTPEIIAAEIKNWNLRSASELRDLIAELASCRDENGDEIDTAAYIDMTFLPTASIPSDIDTSYPVWAVDMENVALVGDNADQLETIDEIRSA